MSNGKAVLGLLAIVAGLYTTTTVSNFAIKKRRALSRALELMGEKGMVNLGAGCCKLGWAMYVCNLPETKLNVDIIPCNDQVSLIDLELASLPFSDKQFDVAFASHILEHLQNWEAALDEWTRIADHVIIVLPHPLSLGGWLHPEHKQHFSFSDMEYIRQNWESIEVFS